MKNNYKRLKLLALILLFILMSVLAYNAMASNLTTRSNYFQQEISGTVTNHQGQPLSGVSISIKGKNQGTISDMHGGYSIRASSPDILVFTYIGYKSLEIPIGNRTHINVKLEEEVTALKAIKLNGGYYTVSNRNSTGNISSIKAETIDKQPVNNPLGAMQGRMPGVRIIQNSGVPGGDYKVEIRGRNSLRLDGNVPLFIIDGVPFPADPFTAAQVQGANLTSHPLNSINPSDIESIEVLKDADATAIYGSRGANGVILITTKSGRGGGTTFDVNLNRGYGEVSHYMNLLNTDQYLEMRREAFSNDEVTPSTFNAPDLELWDPTRYTDWQKQLLGGQAELTNLQASVSGGDTKTSFRLGVGYRKETTVYPGDFSDRKYSGSFHLKHRSEDDRFTASLRGSYVYDLNHLPTDDLTFTAIQLPPNAPKVNNEDGSLNWESSSWKNPLALLRKDYNSHIGNLVTNSTLGYELLPGLKVHSNLGYTVTNTRELQTSPQTAVDPAMTYNQRSSSHNNSTSQTWILEPQLDYETSFGDFDLKGLVGGTMQETSRNSQVLMATGFSSDALLENLQAATDYFIFNSGETAYKYRAIYGRLHLGWKDRYLLNLTGRRDGSSRFGPGRQYANFGALGAAWVFSEEAVVKENLPFISFGKLRFSCGSTGSDQIGDYQYLDLWRSTYYPYNGQGGLVPSRLVNEDFGWETNKKLEGGLEMSLFHNALDLSASYFRNRSSNQLVGYPLPSITGFSSVQYNFPALVENKGWELEINSRNIKGDNFSWSTSLNITFPKNKLVAYDDLESSPYANVYSIGKPLSLVKGYVLNGVDPESGVYDFKDLSGDGFVSYPDDITDLGDLEPDYYGGFSNTLNLKNWSLDFLFQFSRKRGKNYQTSSPPGFRSNQSVEVLDRWQKPGNDAAYQRYTHTYNSAFFSYFNYLSSERSISDASYIRLKNVSLSYDWKLAAHANARLYAQGQNIFTITNYKGLDPENAGTIALPPLRMITFGVQLTF